MVHPEGMADRRGPAGHLDPSTHACRRQGLGQELRPLANPAARSATGQWENLGSFKDPPTASASASTASRPTATTISTCSTSQSSTIGRIDAKTGKFTVYRGEIANSRPRRGAVDEQDRLWFAEYAGNAIGMFDPKTEKIKEWEVPTPWAQPYDVVVDKNGEPGPAR